MIEVSSQVQLVPAVTDAGLGGGGGGGGGDEVYSIFAKAAMEASPTSVWFPKAEGIFNVTRIWLEMLFPCSHP